MFEFNVSKNMKEQNNNDRRRVLAYLLTHLPTLIVKNLKIGVEHGRVVTTFYYNQTPTILFSVVLCE